LTRSESSWFSNSAKAISAALRMDAPCAAPEPVSGRITATLTGPLPIVGPPGCGACVPSATGAG
jgi:hypothetical protein